MGMESDRPLLVVSLIGVLVGIIALVLGIIAITKQPQATPIQSASDGATSDGQTGSNQSPTAVVSSMPPPEKKVWLIGAGHDWGPHEYFDDGGNIRGFSYDIIKAVCDAGGMDCRAVWVPYTDCFVSSPGEHPYGGKALHDHWVDACTGWLVTLDRIHIFDFTNSYLTPETSYFYTLSGATFDPKDIRNKRIGFVAGWYSSEKCIARHQTPTNRGYLMPKDKVIHAVSPVVLVSMLKNNEIDAIFAGYGEMEKFLNQGITRLTQNNFACVLAGSAMMSTKGSPFLAAWNDGFNKLRANGGFQQLCAKAQANHDLQGTVACLT